MTMNRMTPWGQSDDATQIAPGIVFYSTPSHGGFHLSAERLAEIPAATLARTFNGQGRDGWFEEDCDAYLVVAAFPHLFTPRQVNEAVAMNRHRGLAA